MAVVIAFNVVLIIILALFAWIYNDEPAMGIAAAFFLIGLSVVGWGCYFLADTILSMGDTFAPAIARTV